MRPTSRSRTWVGEAVCRAPHVQHRGLLQQADAEVPDAVVLRQSVDQQPVPAMRRRTVSATRPSGVDIRRSLEPGAPAARVRPRRRRRRCRGPRTPVPRRVRRTGRRPSRTAAHRARRKRDRSARAGRSVPPRAAGRRRRPREPWQEDATEPGPARRRRPAFQDHPAPAARTYRPDTARTLALRARGRSRVLQADRGAAADEHPAHTARRDHGCGPVDRVQTGGRAVAHHQVGVARTVADGCRGNDDDARVVRQVYRAGRRAGALLQDVQGADGSVQVAVAGADDHADVPTGHRAVLAEEFRPATRPSCPPRRSGRRQPGTPISTWTAPWSAPTAQFAIRPLTDRHVVLRPALVLRDSV